MRSGLQNPGFIPLIALVIAMLFAATPILCEGWRTYPNGFHLDRPSSVEGISRPQVQYRTEDSLTTFTSRFELGGGLPPEKTGGCLPGRTERDYDRMIEVDGAGSMEISRSEKLRRYFTSGLQICQDSCPDSNSTATTSLSLNSVVSDSQSQAGTGFLPFRLRQTWQQVCQRGLILFRLASFDRSSSRSVITSDRQTSPPNPPAAIGRSAQSCGSSSQQISNTHSSACFDHVAKDTKVGGVASTSGPADRQGSFLAILVSLVVGIIWF